MPVTVKLGVSLRRLTDGAGTVSVAEGAVSAALDELTRCQPGLVAALYDEAGLLRSHINLFVNGEDVRCLERLATELHSGDELLVMPVIAGG
jgi:molybdopterin converting factor small subunit